MNRRHLFRTCLAAAVAPFLKAVPVDSGIVPMTFTGFQEIGGVRWTTFCIRPGESPWQKWIDNVFEGDPQLPVRVIQERETFDFESGIQTVTCRVERL